jgi:hypothetical protein
LALKTAVVATMGALVVKSSAITQPPQVCFDGNLGNAKNPHPGPLPGGEGASVQLGDEARHFFSVVKGCDQKMV